jgi:hypothetical protein
MSDSMHDIVISTKFCAAKTFNRPDFNMIFLRKKQSIL